MWKIEFAESVLKKDVPRLPKEVLLRMKKKLESLRKNPFQYLVRLANLPYYKIRVGDYRIIVSADRTSKTLRVLMIGHRKRVYKRLWRR